MNMSMLLTVDRSKRHGRRIRLIVLVRSVPMLVVLVGLGLGVVAVWPLVVVLWVGDPLLRTNPLGSTLCPTPEV